MCCIYYVENAEIFKKANLINNLSVYNLAKLSLEHNIQLVHISTDYVFDGNKKTPYLPSDKPSHVIIMVFQNCKVKNQFYQLIYQIQL